MPIRPRISVRCEYLVTPISIISEKKGKKILCISDLKARDNKKSASEYTDMLYFKLGHFDHIIKDSDPNLIEFTLSKIVQKLNPFVKRIFIRTCTCGAYEELKNVRMFDLRRVKDNTCTYCGTKLKLKEQDVLISNIHWPLVENFSFYRRWPQTDLDHFLKRQNSMIKISKQIETVRLSHGGVDFGIKHQILWSAMIVYLAKINCDNEVTLHYVNRVQDKAFWVSSIAKIMQPDINLYLKALPIVWLNETSSIADCSQSQIKLLSKALATNKKMIHVSLKSWRY